MIGSPRISFGPLQHRGLRCLGALASVRSQGMNSPRFRQALSKPKLPATDAYIQFVCEGYMTCQLEAQPISPDQLTKQNKLNLLIIHLNLHVTAATC